MKFFPPSLERAGATDSESVGHYVCEQFHRMDTLVGQVFELLGAGCTGRSR